MAWFFICCFTLCDSISAIQSNFSQVIIQLGDIHVNLADIFAVWSVSSQFLLSWSRWSVLVLFIEVNIPWWGVDTPVFTFWCVFNESTMIITSMYVHFAHISSSQFNTLYYLWLIKYRNILTYCIQMQITGKIKKGTNMPGWCDIVRGRI